MLEQKYFGIDDHEEDEAAGKAWKIVHEILGSQKLESINAVYVANYLSLKIAELIADRMTNESGLIRFLEMMNESNRAYMNDVLVEWRQARNAATTGADKSRPQA
jgi:hypothetical protein